MKILKIVKVYTDSAGWSLETLCQGRQKSVQVVDLVDQHEADISVEEMALQATL